MKILIYGAGGQLGFELMRQGQVLGLDIHGIDFPQTDITDNVCITNDFTEINPELVVNAAAYTNVDGAESEPELAWAINRDGPAHLARRCAENKIPLIHISTDYVFDGTKNSPYRETDPVSPLGVYGRSKAEGEAAVRTLCDEHIILRTAWLYGAHGQNFVKTILRLAAQKEVIRVVADQYGSPTSAADLAETILTIAGRLRRPSPADWGTYHYCGKGVTNWHAFAERIVALSRPHGKIKTIRVEPITSAEYPTKARRPAYSALDCNLMGKQFGISPKPWQDSLNRIIQRLWSTPGN
jgi:dTDP-4-dehydrorhamnose reductase